jgi:deazaflavin-dependent oxidoreductase (nitroreductase family)
LEDDLVRWGRVLRIETRGRLTGHAARAVVGFVERSDGTVVVAAGSPDANWARNLLEEPLCRITIADATWEATARELAGAEHAGAVRDLILRYGTPSENLGPGPAFEVRRAGEPLAAAVEPPEAEDGRSGLAPDVIRPA